MRDSKFRLNDTPPISLLLLLAACSGSGAPGLPEEPSDRESNQAVPVDELSAKILFVTNSGELCPTVPSDFDKNGLSDNIMLGSSGEIVSVGLGPVMYACDSPEAMQPIVRTSTPSCTVTLELEVPSGYTIGAPTAVWKGLVTGPSGSVSATRTYAFEDGGSATTAPTILPMDFEVFDRDQPAFSATCSGTERVRVSATFQANLSSPEAYVHLDEVHLLTSWRGGAPFKEGCAPGERVSATPGLSGEWCAGYPQRPCAEGLTCEIHPRRVDPGSTRVEGTCADPAEPAPVAEAGEACGGVRNVQCESGYVCWYKPDAQPGLPGECISEAAQKGDPCRTGSPSLECAPPLVCWDVDDSCVESFGRLGDPCGQAGLTDCASPLFCHPMSGFCVEATGGAGDPCGSDEYPACQSPLLCEEGRCKETRGKFDEPCGEGTFGCIPQLACLEGVCRPRPERTCL